MFGNQRGESETTNILGLLGSILAGLVSYNHWHSVFLAIFHAVFGWGYVIYSVLRYGIPKF